MTAEAGSTVLLARMIGANHAANVLLTGRWVYAAHAREIGLANEVAPAGKALEQALKYADAFQNAPVASLVATKSLLVEARLEAGRDARRHEYVLFHQLEGAPANIEALAAFREKRQPDFSRH